jgi:hypothetical protein
MTDDIDPALTGSAFELANAGYVPMRDPDEKRERHAIGSDGSSLREAADQRSEHERPIIVREYLDGKGRPAPSDEAITLMRAARDHARAKAMERDASEHEDAEASTQSAGASHFPAEHGESSDAERSRLGGPNDGVAQPGNSPDTEFAEDELAPELEKALQHPQVRQAIEEKIAEAEIARQNYRDGLTAATQVAQASFLAQFPEFSAMHPDQLPAALEKLSREDPAKFARIQAAVVASEGLLARQAQEHQRQAETSRQHFQRFAAGEDARFDTMLKDEPASVRQAVAVEIMAIAKESGIQPTELNHLFHTEPVMRNATFQRMMYDAAKYRLMMKAKDAIAARPVPPVLRPGVAITAAERDRADLRSLNARLSSSGDLKDAVALYQARRSNRP